MEGLNDAIAMMAEDDLRGPDRLDDVHRTLLKLQRDLAQALDDLTAVKARESRLQHEAFHDPLTDLPNRRLFDDRLEHAIRTAQRSGRTLDLAMLDLDRFKAVNDRWGHQAGDALLVQVARRLMACVRKGDSVARLGGDEFAILFPHQTGSLSTLDVARRVKQALREPFFLPACGSVEIDVSIGLARYPHGAGDGSQLMKGADTAMYDAKKRAAGIGWHGQATASGWAPTGQPGVDHDERETEVTFGC